LNAAGTPCDSEGYDLPPGTPPPPPEIRTKDDFSPFIDEEEFQFADFLYTREQMSAGNIDILMQLMAAWNKSRASQLDEEFNESEPTDPPFNSANHMHSIIDSIPLGDVPWEGFKVTYDGDIPENNPPSWMTKTFEVWYRNPLEILEAQIGNPDFDGEIDYAPKQVLGKNGKRQFTDVLSGDWAWEQAVCSYSLPSLSMNNLNTKLSHFTILG
jgi:Plavaka transposase